MRGEGRFIMTKEIRDVIEAIWSNASSERKQEALRVESTLLGYEANEDKVIDQLINCIG